MWNFGHAAVNAYENLYMKWWIISKHVWNIFLSWRNEAVWPYAVRTACTMVRRWCNFRRHIRMKCRPKLNNECDLDRGFWWKCPYDQNMGVKGLMNRAQCVHACPTTVQNNFPDSSMHYSHAQSLMLCNCSHLWVGTCRVCVHVHVIMFGRVPLH